MNVKLKKILSCFLIMLLLFNALFSCVVYADEHGGSSGDLDVTPSITIPPSPPDPAEFLIRMILPDGGEAIDYISDWLEKRWKTDDDRQKDYSVSDDGSTVHLHKQFVDDLNQAVQDKIHAMDGYYIIEPLNKNSPDEIAKKHNFDSGSDNYKKIVDSFESARLVTSYNSNVCDDQYIYYQDFYFYLKYGGSRYEATSYYPSTGSWAMAGNGASGKGAWLSINYGVVSLKDTTFQVKLPIDYYASSSLSGSLKYIASHCWGFPFKLFYSKQAVINYIDKGRTYAPQLPSTTISIPIKYINNSVSLPDITYNINTTNKTEVEIQNEYNTTLNNYLNDLNNFTDGSDKNPTPTPSGGGSGDFGDGSTPTPTPPLGDGGSDQDGEGSDGWLKKIYDQLVKLSDSVSQHFEKEETFEDK